MILQKAAQAAHVTNLSSFAQLSSGTSQVINHLAPLLELTPADGFAEVGGIRMRESKEEKRATKKTQKRAQDKHRQPETKRRKFSSH